MSSMTRLTVAGVLLVLPAHGAAQQTAPATRVTGFPRSLAAASQAHPDVDTMSTAATAFRAYEGVICREPIPRSFCKSVVDRMPTHLKTAIRSYRREFPSRWRGSFGPNCHWFALSYFFEDVATCREPVNLRKVTGYFERLGFVPCRTPEFGALAVFTFAGYDISDAVDLATGTRVPFAGASYTELMHSAIYVGELGGDSVLLQKDDARSDTFSIRLLDGALKELRAGIGSLTAGSVSVAYLSGERARWTKPHGP